MKNVLIIGVGVAGMAGLAYYLYTKNQQQAIAASAGQNSIVSSPQANQISTSATSLPAQSVVKQTMWKDRDGHIFEMTSEKRKWGYHIKVDGGSNGELEVLKLGSDGYMIGADNNGSVFQFKNGKWNYVIKDNKSSAGEYLVKNGLPNIYQSVNGLGCYCLS